MKTVFPQAKKMWKHLKNKESFFKETDQIP
jgi:hypothetical protein